MKSTIHDHNNVGSSQHQKENVGSAVNRELSRDEEEATSALFALVTAAINAKEKEERTISSSSERIEEDHHQHIQQRSQIEFTSLTASSEIDDDEASQLSSDGSKTGDTKKTNQPLFPEILMTILTDSSHSDIITFLPDNCTFCILQPKQFATDLMPRCFSIRTFISFTRKLTRWGFESVQDARCAKKPTFRHTKFRKGDFLSCRKIKCMGKYSKNGALSSPSTSSDISMTKSDEDMKLSGDDSSRTGESQLPPPAAAPRPSIVRSLAKAQGLEETTATSLSRSSSATAGKNGVSVKSLLSSQDSATRSIIQAAIETLMRDKVHSRQVLLKHQKRLSAPSLLGVIPLTEQLLNSGDDETGASSLPTETTSEEKPQENDDGDEIKSDAQDSSKSLSV